QDLFTRNKLTTTKPVQSQPDYDLNTTIANKRQLEAALVRIQSLQAGTPTKSPRTLQRWRRSIAGLQSPQERLSALIPRGGGNRTPRIPQAVTRLAEEPVREYHDVASKPPIQATYLRYVHRCDEAGLRPMGRSSFYEWIKGLEDIKAREGRRKAYQKSPIPLTYDYDQPVHGVLPHEVVYVDHTVVNVF